MANVKILEAKQKVIDEIKNHVEEANSIVLFDYRGITDSEAKELRVKLRESGSDYKVYKNTLVRRAMDSLNINMDSYLNGPKAVVFGTDAIAPIKALAEFSKEHPALVLKVGYVDGNVTDEATLKQLAAIPGRTELLTMFAAGLMEHVKNVAICLDLHSKNLED